MSCSRGGTGRCQLELHRVPGEQKLPLPCLVRDCPFDHRHLVETVERSVSADGRGALRKRLEGVDVPLWPDQTRAKDDVEALICSKVIEDPASREPVSECFLLLPAARTECEARVAPMRIEQKAGAYAVAKHRSASGRPPAG